MTTRPDSNSPPVNAWMALRLSRPEQEEVQRALSSGLPPPDILAEHRAILLHLAAQHGLTIPPENIYEDVESGEYLAQRPAFQRLLARLRKLPANAGGVLLCMAVDRLTRGVPSERAYVQETLDKAGIRVVTPHSTTNLQNPDEALLFELRGSLARHELQRYKQRVRDTLDAQVRRGHVLSGAKVFGYVWDKNLETLVPHPVHFPVLQALCRDALTHSCERLAAKYGLSVRTVTNILRNPKVCGWPAERHKKGFDPERGKKVGKVLPRREWRWPERPGDYPPACSREHWEAIQAVMDHRTRGMDRGGEHNAWCRDIVVFPQAPGKVSLGAWGYRDKSIPTYDRSHYGGPRLYYPRAEVHTAASAAVLAVLGDPRALRRQLQAYQAKRAATPAELSPQALVETISVQLERRRRQMADLLERETLADDPEERVALATVRGNTRADISRLSEEMQQAYSAPLASPELDEMAAYLERSAEGLAGEWPTASSPERRKITRAIIESIEVIVDCDPGHRRYERGILAVRLRAPFRS